MLTKSKKQVAMAGMLVAISVGLILYVPTIMATQIDASLKSARS